jgi:opacity protein-like surface antigen
MPGSSMRTAIVTAVFACIAAAAQAAQAQTYWRVDVGWSAPVDKADFKDNDFYNSGNILGDPTFTQPGTLNNIDGSLIFGAGAGYRFTSGLRGDVTLTYRGFYNLNDSTFEADYNAHLSSTTLMVNGYYDFTAGGVRPYIGAGIGWARNRTDKLVQDFRFGFANTFAGATRDDTAVALMAGVGIPHAGVTLDIGLRYIDMGKFETGNTAALGITGGHTGKLSAYEFTFGVRF